MSLKLRVAILYPFRNLDTVPSLTQSAELLAEAGYSVDVYTRRGGDFRPPAFAHPGIEVLYDLPRGERRGAHRLLPARLSHILHVASRHLRRRYLCALAVDPQGLVWARRHFRWTGVPVAYYSLELLVLDGASSERQRAWKELEREMLCRAPFAVVQDPARAALLRDSTGLQDERIVLVPNAPLGPARHRPSRYWHRRFDLADDERVVLHAGSIDPWTGIDDIVRSAASWPAGFTLVVHTRFAAEDSAAVNRLRDLADRERVRFSLQPVPRREYDELVDGADIGLAFYEPESESDAADPNLRTIGLSSGKIAYYLRAGVPAVVNDASSVGAFVEKADCGVAVENADGISLALRTLERDLAGYRQRALDTFDRHLDFARGFGEVLVRLARLSAGPARPAADPETAGRDTMRGYGRRREEANDP